MAELDNKAPYPLTCLSLALYHLISMNSDYKLNTDRLKTETEFCVSTLNF